MLSWRKRSKWTFGLMVDGTIVDGSTYNFTRPHQISAGCHGNIRGNPVVSWFESCGDPFSSTFPFKLCSQNIQMPQKCNCIHILHLLCWTLVRNLFFEIIQDISGSSPLKKELFQGRRGGFVQWLVLPREKTPGLQGWHRAQKRGFVRDPVSCSVGTIHLYVYIYIHCIYIYIHVYVW